ncbi:unnamed protein product [Chrysodeixis includens]|uniref:Seminal fluid protein HACP044 n=1 Tax=Chrysodeixis includens TaxID=689277 RepID=A0A9P0FRN8_CHRIL|nr:unnamed protein product [Chrysodeixis includens]
MKTFVVLSMVIVSCLAQKSPYAGRGPVGFPAVETTTADPLANRFGDSADNTPINLPIEALGDVELVKRLSRLPLDNQPFWLINWRALEANRRNPQTYPARANSFIEPANNMFL